MKNRLIPLSVPNLRGNELKYATEAIQSEWVSTAGPFVNKFESDIAAYVRARGAVACQNGTSGLHIALLTAGVTRDDIVIVPALTFVATVNPVTYIGAEPVFMDCDDTLCMDASKLREFCENECVFTSGRLVCKLSGKPVKAIIAVHVFGNMANMEAICDVAREFHIKLIEDATEALGTYCVCGQYAGKYAGTIGDIGVYSFNGNKIITTGGGGMIVSDNEDYLRRARHLTIQAKCDETYFIHDEVGYNYRMTNLQAALGLAQLEQVEAFISAKTENYQKYARGIRRMPGLRLLGFRADTRPNYWFYSLLIDDAYSLKRDELLELFSKNGIQTRPIWWPINKLKIYERARAYRVEKAKYYWARVINLPCSTNLSDDDIGTVIAVLENI